jgi:2-dehydro-3-deoxyphosphogluconate aldolase / (4S)-4-hydroxy-2-oxoglutarate aldolase
MDTQQMSPTRTLMHVSPVITILHIDRLADAAPLAHALMAAGNRVLEITCRSECAIEAAVAMAKAEPDAIVGLGTVIEPDQMRAVADLGLKFAVSPGLDEDIVRLAQDLGVPFLPGVVTPSEVMLARRLGLRELKFFPCEPSGGTLGLKMMEGPFPDVVFCPTGRVTQENRDEYLALPNVPCVGGSWMVPKQAVKDGDWQAVTDAARKAVTF